MRAFKQLQDEALDWIGKGDDTGLLRDLVKVAINRSHQSILTQEQYDFMLWPRVETLTVTASNKYYTLHPLFLQALFFYNPTTDEYLEEIPPRSWMESEEDWQDGEAAEPERFSLTTLSLVANQPASAGTVTVTAASAESSSNSIVVGGIVSGAYREETLSSSTTWTTLTGTLSFDKIVSITKVGATWTQTITVSRGATEILVLLSTEWGKEYRQLELMKNPTTSATIQYRFYQQPRQLVYDNDIPQLPTMFSEVLVFGALLKLVGYSRATADEVRLWTQRYEQLLAMMKQTHRNPRSLGARPRFVKYIPRI